MQPDDTQAMIKEEEQKHLSGLDEAVIKNIDACKQLSTVTHALFGPNGMHKMVIHHLVKLFATNDASATTGNELQLPHPAVKILISAAKAQQEEVGDGVNLTISFAVELLRHAEELIRMGLRPSDIISGYSKAVSKTIEALDELVEAGSETMDMRFRKDVVSRLRAVMVDKQLGRKDTLCSLVADACYHVCPEDPANFNVDNVRVTKLLRDHVPEGTVFRGMVFKGNAVGSIKRMEEAKVAVFAGGLDTSADDTKETVLILLENYTKSEEPKLEKLIKSVADSGAKVIVNGDAVGEMALHFCERYEPMVLKISSKFDLQRFCRMTGSVAILELSQPNPYDLGYIDLVAVVVLDGVRATVVQNEQAGNSASTVVLLANTESMLDDLERAVYGGVNTYKVMRKDSRTVPGAAATEIELARRVKEFSFKETGLDQYAIAKFAESFEIIPVTLAENAGLNAMEIISSLYAGHANGNTKVGIDLQEGVCKDASVINVWDLYVTKFLSLKHAADAACTILRADQIIMA
ncbi:hypothetical protein BT93_A1794 [Corymbia citriodora subsp. variegata]|nr:hypothetical protein BT93_A1794 [Corymbia citriodora subsp. variegata]